MPNLTFAQLDTIKTALLAEVDPTVVAARGNGADIGRNDTALVAWCNSLTAIDAWNETVDSIMIFEATVPTLYDGLTAAKRASQDRIERFVTLKPLDIRKARYRTLWVDIWGTTDATAVLQALRRKATRAEIYVTPDIVGNRKTTNTVVGLDLTWTGTVDTNDLGRAFNPAFAAALAARPNAIVG